MAINNILLAVGKSDQDRIEILSRAVSNVAGPTGASVHLLHVFSEDGFDEAVSKLDFDSPADADPEAVARRRPFVRDLQNALQSENVRVTVSGVVGDTAGAILDTSETVDADTIFMSGRKRRPTGKAVFGSAVQEVMLNADCPVTYVREGMHVD